MPAAEGDEALAAAFAAHEGWAFSEAYRRYAALLYSAAYNVLGDADDAQDCIADAVAKLWRSRGAYSPSRGNLRSFLVVCVRNEAISRRRRESSQGSSGGAPCRDARRARELRISDPIERDRVRSALLALPAATAYRSRTGLLRRKDAHRDRSRTARTARDDQKPHQARPAKNRLRFAIDRDVSETIAREVRSRRGSRGALCARSTPPDENALRWTRTFASVPPARRRLVHAEDDVALIVSSEPQHRRRPPSTPESPDCCNRVDLESDARRSRTSGRGHTAQRWPQRCCLGFCPRRTFGRRTARCTARCSRKATRCDRLASAPHRTAHFQLAKSSPPAEVMYAPDGSWYVVVVRAHRSRSRSPGCTTARTRCSAMPFPKATSRCSIFPRATAWIGSRSWMATASLQRPRSHGEAPFQVGTGLDSVGYSGIR